MKAIVCDRYGPPDVLRLDEVERPTPRDDQVLVMVYASSLNAADLEIMGGSLFARISGPFRPRNRIPGSDVAGRVVEVGKKVKRLKIGDAVFGDLFMCGCGAFAEYVAASEAALMLKPDSISFEDAATIPPGGQDRPSEPSRQAPSQEREEGPDQWRGRRHGHVRRKDR